MGKMTIGKLAKNAGVNKQTVRYYENLKLLLPEGRTESGYKIYGEVAKERLSFILHAKNTGFTLKEIDKLLRLELGRANCGDVKKEAIEKIKAIDAKINALAQMKEVLGKLILTCNERLGIDECPILKAFSDRR